MAEAKSLLVEFKYNNTVDYVVEFSPHKIRLYCHSYLIGLTREPLREPGQEPPADMNCPPIEIDTPYSADDLWDNQEKCWAIQTIQNADVLYIFHEKYPIKVLCRKSHVLWQLKDLELKNGPFLAMDTSETVLTVFRQPNGVTITADKPTFHPQDVGRLLRLHVYNDTARPWVADLAVDPTEIVYSDKKYYEALDDGVCGTQKPIHTQGVRTDGKIRWKYVHTLDGVAKITEVLDDKNVRVIEQTPLPFQMKDGTVCWQWGMLGGDNPYPKSGAFFRNRFCFLVNTPKGPNVCLSCSGDYNNFADTEWGGSTAETALTVPVLNTEFNEGKWLYADDVLFVGTGTSEFYIDAVTTSSPMAADNVKIVQISKVGSKAVQPVGIGGHIFFADRFGLSLRDLTYNYYNDGYDQIDISMLGKHLFEAGIVDMAYQEIPDKILWCLMANGTLTALTFSAEHEVAALSRHDFKAEAESLAVVSDRTAKRDEVWLEFKRMIDGEIVRSVEVLDNGMARDIPTYVYHNHQEIESSKADYILTHAFYLDGAVVFNRTDGRTTFQVPKHLEMKRLTIFADGEILPEQIAMNGQIKLNRCVKRAVIGEKIISQFIPQHIYIPTENGSGIGQKQRINHVLLMLYLSGGGKIGEDEHTLTPLYYRGGDAVMGKVEQLFSGNMEVLFNGRTSAFAHSATLLIENDSPLPMNILAIVPSMDVA